MPTILALLALALTPAFAAEAVPVYKNPAAPVEARVDDLLGRMTLDEKIDLLSGVDDMDLRANARLGIPKLRMTDGPLGVRLNAGDKATAFPAGIALASAWDPALLQRVAAQMGEETLALGRDMLLGPCINIARTPQGGRNFESFGEDPYLAARLAAAYVTGLQSQKVLASTKHFALNNQETERGTIDVRASERAIREIFLPAFAAAVRAGTWTVMASYNQINGHHASENDVLQNQILKKEWGFAGFIVSDWGATHSTVGAANGGLDVEMPSGEFFGGGKLQAALKDGSVAPAVVDDKARRVLRAMIGGGVFDRKDSDRPARSVAAGPEGAALALRAAQEGIVLLKNEGGILPLGSGVKSVALIGPSAGTARPSGGGSSEVPAPYAISALDGLRERAGAALDVRFVAGLRMPGELIPLEKDWLTPPPGKGEGHGLYAEYFNNMTLEGKPAVTQIDPPVNFDWGGDVPWKGITRDNFSIRWTGRLRVPKSGDYELAARSDDGTRLWLDGKLIVDNWKDQAATTMSAKVKLEAGRDYDLKLEYYQHGGGSSVKLGFIPATGGALEDAAAAAAKADAALVFVGASDELESEGKDRDSLELPAGQDELIEAVAGANKNTIVVLQIGSPALMSKWLGKVRGVVQAWYPGQEGGRAIADVLLGRVNPSGKLPVTFPKRWEDSPAYGHYPGANGRVDYAEGIFVGYRGFDKNKIAPLFPFGHGLSYTTFAYSNLAVDVKNPSALAPEVSVSFDVKNTGERAGAEIAQLYVRDERPKVERPEQELKGFSRVELAPGETKRVTLSLDRSAFAYWDDAAHAWAAAPGRFTVRAGASSRDIRLSKDLELK